MKPNESRRGKIKPSEKSLLAVLFHRNISHNTVRTGARAAAECIEVGEMRGKERKHSEETYNGPVVQDGHQVLQRARDLERL